MNILVQKYKFLIYPIVVVLSSLVIIIFVIVPQIKVLIFGQGNLNKAETSFNNLTTKASELEELDSNDLNRKLQLTLAALPLERDSASIIGIFKELANSAGMNLSSLHVGSASEKSNDFVIIADVVGSPQSLNVLLNNIESSPRVMRLLSVESSTGLGDTVTATVSVAVFYSPAPKTLGPIDAALPELSSTDTNIITSLAKSGTSSISQPTTLPSGKANPFE